MIPAVALLLAIGIVAFSLLAAMNAVYAAADCILRRLEKL